MELKIDDHYSSPSASVFSFVKSVFVPLPSDPSTEVIVRFAIMTWSSNEKSAAGFTYAIFVKPKSSVVTSVTSPIKIPFGKIPPKPR